MKSISKLLKERRYENIKKSVREYGKNLGINGKISTHTSFYMRDLLGHQLCLIHDESLLHSMVPVGIF